MLRHLLRQISVKLKDSRRLSQGQDGYFLCVYVKIATISKAVVSIIYNSSYVLIKSLLSGKVSRSSEKHVPRLPGEIYYHGSSSIKPAAGSALF